MCAQRGNGYRRYTGLPPSGAVPPARPPLRGQLPFPQGHHERVPATLHRRQTHVCRLRPHAAADGGHRRGVGHLAFHRAVAPGHHRRRARRQDAPGQPAVPGGQRDEHPHADDDPGRVGGGPPGRAGRRRRHPCQLRGGIRPAAGHAGPRGGPEAAGGHRPGTRGHRGDERRSDRPGPGRRGGTGQGPAQRAGQPGAAAVARSGARLPRARRPADGAGAARGRSRRRPRPRCAVLGAGRGHRHRRVPRPGVHPQPDRPAGPRRRGGARWLPGGWTAPAWRAAPTRPARCCAPSRPPATRCAR